MQYSNLTSIYVCSIHFSGEVMFLAANQPARFTGRAEPVVERNTVFLHCLKVTFRTC